MGNVTLLQRGYARGAKRDYPRDQMPPGSVWDLLDYIPNILGAPIRKRGGWGYGSNALGAGSYAAALAFADFSGGSQLVLINDAGTLFKVVPATGVVTSKGAARVPVSRPVLHRDILVIPSPDGSLSTKKYDGAAAPADLSATAPAGMYADVYKDRTLLGNISGNAQRLFFGPAGAPTGVWDVAETFIDASFPLAGVAAMKNRILLFGSGRTERIIGSVPPPNTDMEKGPLFDIGCIDARSIVSFGDTVVWAAEDGIWLTDGAVPENLTESAGFLSYWLELLVGYDSTTWTIAAGIDRGHYVVAIMNGSTFVDAIALNVNARSWFRISNLSARMFASSVGISTELYFALRDEARAGKLSPIFEPTDAVRNDADGTPVLPVVEFPFFKDDAALKRWHDGYLTYALEAPSTAPTLELSYITSPDSTAYTVIAKTFGEQADVDRGRVPLRFRGRGVGFKLRQTAASADTRIHELEADVHPLERSR